MNVERFFFYILRKLNSINWRINKSKLVLYPADIKVLAGEENKLLAIIIIINYLWKNESLFSKCL